jgi:hypothetical protein
VFRKHLSQYTDDGLRAEIRRLVDEQVHESRKLDYKQSVSLDSKKARREIAKDISSFANETGGAVIYGIPEDRKSHKVAVPMKPYGIAPLRDFETRVENVCADLISPRLPDLNIRRVETECEDKVVYVVWHPESWFAPHMVEGDDRRYYRRGELRAMKMTEREVRDKYAQVRSALGRLDEFLDSKEVNFYTDLSLDRMTHFVCAPILLVPDRIEVSGGAVKEWLDEHENFTYGWKPSSQGVRAGVDLFVQVESARSRGMPDTYCEIHRNGTISHAKTAPFADNDRTELHVVDMLKRLDSFLSFCCDFYKEVGYCEPLRLRLRITRCKTLSFFFMPNREFAAQDPAAKIALRGADTFQVDVYESGPQLIHSPKAVLKKAADAVYQSFGLPEADCFNSDMSFKTVWTWSRC